MKHIGIQTPCSEDRGNMTPNEKGSFCHKCAKQVHDFTNKSTGEIKQIFRDMMGQEICGRMTSDQEIALNAEFEAWKFQSKQGFQRAMVFSLVVVFGLTLFSCSNEQDRQQIKQIQAVALNAMNVSAGETPDSKSIEQQTLHENEVLQLKKIRGKYEAYLEPDCIYDIEYAIPEEQQIIYQTQIDGGIGSSMEYRDYLRATDIKVIDEQELDELRQIIPTEFAATAYPNPTANVTTFELNVPNKTRFDVGLYDMNGKLIQKVCDGKINRGTYTQDLDLTNLNPGIYLLIISSEDYKETIRISKI
ncbi:MAG: T9SS type A sorting domain-containing protein [Fluviicola sp.]|nr:T9SS type A sorting domain-containing protein [Fluviicola sp.]